jgi:hypothetical protein
VVYSEQSLFGLGLAPVVIGLSDEKGKRRNKCGKFNKNLRVILMVYLGRADFPVFFRSFFWLTSLIIRCSRDSVVLCRIVIIF